MLNRLWIAAAVLIFVIGLSGLALAQDDTETANACFEGGSMEGKCALDADGDGVLEDFEEDWAWECGWYVNQFESDLIESNQVPDRCASVVPSPFRCFYPSADIPYSILYIGPANTIGNALRYTTPDCTGAGIPFEFSAIIIADSLEEATAVCESFGSDIMVDLLANFGYLNAPPNYYGCDVFSLAPTSGVPARFTE